MRLALIDHTTGGKLAIAVDHNVIENMAQALVEFQPKGSPKSRFECDREAAETLIWTAFNGSLENTSFLGIPIIVLDA